MSRSIFVNLAVKDLDASMAFFRSLGFEFNPGFTSPQGAGMVVAADSIFVMLLTESFFQTFTKKPVANAHAVTEVLVCLSCSSRQEVDDLVAKALAAGGTAPNAKQENDFMYAHGFTDLDGHGWELVHMAGMPPQG